MHLLTLNLLSFLLLTLTTALQTVTIHHLPSTPSLSSPPTPLATLTFSPNDPSLSRLTSLRPPPNSTFLVQVGICYEAHKCRTSAAYAYSFHPPYTGRFVVNVGEEEEGEVLGVSWRAWRMADREKDGVQKVRGDFDIRVAKKAPSVWIDAAVKEKGRERQLADGEKKEEGEEEGDERTFFQK
ncbi:MAG: hypothetical protein LQ344_006147 [Seirophora lacunosa]|nr:MAG: hypothetical protein LQ344_006147 [Seirophora lacunosa]